MTETTPFGYCLNTSTIRAQGLSLVEMIDLVTQTGYDGIEPWVRELDAFVEEGGSLDKLRRRIADAGLTVPNLIGFFEWAVDDPVRRAAGLEEAERAMALCAAVGCSRLAAPPSGITQVEVPLPVLAERYRAVLELGTKMGVVPVVEFWGMSRTLSRLGDAVYVAMESGHRDACVLVDVFHMYKSGSPHAGLRLAGPETIALVHINDYPTEPARERITDADRVYPGDGIAPLGQILRDLTATGYTGMLSLELFNETYWGHDPQRVAETGLAKMKDLVERSADGQRRRGGA
jgi:2-keto-myo-inositol isomerase